jgi:hypothetical protein
MYYIDNDGKFIKTTINRTWARPIYINTPRVVYNHIHGGITRKEVYSKIARHPNNKYKNSLLHIL